MARYTELTWMLEPIKYGDHVSYVLIRDPGMHSPNSDNPNDFHPVAFVEVDAFYNRDFMPFWEKLNEGKLVRVRVKLIEES